MVWGAADPDDQGKGKAMMQCYKYNNMGYLSLVFQKREVQIIEKEDDLGEPIYAIWW